MIIEDDSCNHLIQINKNFIGNLSQYSKILKNPTFIQLDTLKNALFGDIGMISVNNDTIYIFDVWYTKSLFSYTSNGKFINKISRIGRGPGEYTTPTDFFRNATNGEISILDWTTRKILTYDKFGNFTREVKFHNQLTSFYILDNIIYGLNTNPSHPGEQMLNCYDLNGNSFLSGLPAQNTNCDGGINLSLGGNFVKSENEVRFTISERSTVYSLKDDIIKPFIKLQYSDDLLNKEDDKPNILYSYSENSNYAFFKFKIHNLPPYDVFYNFETSDVCVISPFTIDDITKLPVTLLGISGNKMIGKIESQSIQYINELLYRGEITDPIFEDYVADYKADILVLYDIIGQ